MLDQPNIGVSVGVSSISLSINNKPITNNDIKLILEWAGMRLLSLPRQYLGPRSTHSSWPHIPTTNHLSDKLKFNVNPIDIDQIDTIYELINLVPDSISRRILQSRSLITPYNHRYLITWSRLSRLLDLDRRQIQSIHSNSLSFIRQHISSSGDMFRNLIDK